MCSSDLVKIEAIDPLADAYSEIMKQHHISPSVQTKRGEGENVVEIFGSKKFDLVFARNCLDHSYDAIKAVTEMIQATKPGGIIYLWHNQDEAESLSYQGLHQWNFHLDKNELLVWKGNRQLNVNRHFAQQLQPLRCEIKNGMIEAVYRKLNQS